MGEAGSQASCDMYSVALVGILVESSRNFLQIFYTYLISWEPALCHRDVQITFTKPLYFREITCFLNTVTVNDGSYAWQKQVI